MMMAARTTDTSAKLGHVVYWSGNDADVPVRDVQAALKAAGLNEEMAYDPEKKNAFIRAVRKAEEEKLVRRVEENGQKLVFQFTREFLSGQQLDYSCEALVTFSKTTAGIYSTSKQVEVLVAKHVLHTSTHFLPRDITALIQRIFKKEADLLPLRARGAVYFIPQAYTDLVSKVQDFMGRIGWTLESLNIGKEEASKGAVYRAFIEEMKTTLAEMTATVTEIEQTPDEDTATRSLTMRIRNVKESMTRVRNYEELLSATADDLKAGLKSVHDRLTAKLARI